MAQLLLQNRYQTTSGGSGQGTALLFEVNVLFEAYIGRLVMRALAGLSSALHCRELDCSA